MSKNKQRVARQISDTNKVVWLQYSGPMNAAAQQLNAAIRAVNDAVATAIIRAEGLDPAEWQFDMDRACLIPRPTPQNLN